MTVNCENPVEIFIFLHDFILNFTTEIKVSDKTWKMTFDGPYIEEKDEEDEETKEEDELKEKTMMKMELLQVRALAATRKHHLCSSYTRTDNDGQQQLY